MKHRHLITVDELRSAGALDVPPSWRKSLSAGREERNLFSDLSDDDDPRPEQQPSTLRDQPGNAAADETE